MRNHFDEQLKMLNVELITMGALCEEAISRAARCLTADDRELKNQVFESDRQIDQKERDIENLCMKLLLHQQPVARDLRTVSSALKMISDMERIGDQASDIAEMAEFVSKSKTAARSHIYEMAQVTVKMVTDSIESFVKKDKELAVKTIRGDDMVDSLFLQVKKEVMEAIRDGRSNGESLVDLLMIAKYFERIGDHAENIAEWVIYSLTGRHKTIEE